MGATIVVDALWGDSGKGKIAAYLAEHDGYDCCARAGTGTNAGHSLSLDGVNFMKTRQLPLAGLMGKQILAIGSGVAVDPEVLLEELERFDDQFDASSRLVVDGRCPVILPEYREREAANAHLTQTVGSTCSGTGVAQSEYALRNAVRVQDEPRLEKFTGDVASMANNLCREGGRLLIEGSQGTHLSLALSHDYPYCTSDNCTAVACADDVGLSWQHISEVMLVVKALPSRVGTGPMPFEMGVEEQDRLGIEEYGVTTGRRRRKASKIPMDYLKEAVLLNGPTQIALTFCDHVDATVRDAMIRNATVRGKNGSADAFESKSRKLGELPNKIRALVDEIEEQTNVPVTILETGKAFGSIIDLRPGQ